MPAKLVHDLAWSDRTTTSWNSQWKCWVEFSTQEDRPVLPITEAKLVAYVGWLANERKARRPAMRSTSLPHYISAVLQMLLTLTVTAVPPIPFVHPVIRAYGKWEGDIFPEPKVRCGVPASVIQRIWAHGMVTDSAAKLRNSAVCVFACCQNGLMESSFMSLQSSHVNLDTNGLCVRLSVVNGKASSAVPFSPYDGLGQVGSPVDLWMRWSQARGTHRRYFALDEESQEWMQGSLTRALQKCLEDLGVVPPPHGKYTSQSMRIGAHTEQILVGVPVEVSMAGYGWGPNSQEMAVLYFDRSIEVSARILHASRPRNIIIHIRPNYVYSGSKRLLSRCHSSMIFNRPPQQVLPENTALRKLSYSLVISLNVGQSWFMRMKPSHQR